MSYVFKVLKPEEYNPYTIDPHTHLTQSVQYGLWQKNLKKEVYYFAIYNKDNQVEITGQYILYPLLYKKNYLYAPYGPIIHEHASKEALMYFLDRVKDFAAKHNCIFVRSEIPEKYNYTHSNSMISKSSYTQERYEWMIDLEDTDEAILTQMEQKTRYNIRLAEKKGLSISINNTDDVLASTTFFDLMDQTAHRNNFRLHENNYYKTILENISQEKNGKLIVISKEDTPLAINLLVHIGDTVHYLFGGSSDTYKNLMASYLIHFESIKLSRNMGARYYSFGAVQKEEDKTNSLYGISHFKKRFGGMYNAHPPLHDDIIEYHWYIIYGLYKLLRKVYSYLPL